MSRAKSTRWGPLRRRGRRGPPHVAAGAPVRGVNALRLSGRLMVIFGTRRKGRRRRRVTPAGRERALATPSGAFSYSTSSSGPSSTRHGAQSAGARETGPATWGAREPAAPPASRVCAARPLVGRRRLPVGRCGGARVREQLRAGHRGRGRPDKLQAERREPPGGRSLPVRHPSRRRSSGCNSPRLLSEDRKRELEGTWSAETHTFSIFSRLPVPRISPGAPCPPTSLPSPCWAQRW